MEMESNGGWKFQEECSNDEKSVVRDEIVKVEQDYGVFDVISDAGFMRRGGSIADRRAAKCGFDAPKINVARLRSVYSPPSSPGGAVSPYITIPAGISPTALLDSPVMLPNSQGAYPSPTTGTFQSPSFNHESRMLQSVNGAADGNVDSDVGSSFNFKLDGGIISFPCISDLTDQPPVDFKCPVEYRKQNATGNCTTSSSDYAVKLSEEIILPVNSTASNLPHYTNTEGDQMFPLSEPANEGDTELCHPLEGQQKEAYLPIEMLRTSEDGYNWRKYGQKQVKGSEYPRSYYKCTNPNCEVKKKVERSLDGQITEIIYKGAHNHRKPQPCRRAIPGCQFSPNETSGTEIIGPGIKADGGALWRNIQLGLNDMRNGLDYTNDGLKRTSSTSVLTEISDIPNTRGKLIGAFESSGNPELSSAFASHDGDEEDGAIHGSISLEEDANDGESELKRRRKENCITETSLTSRTTREPRIVIQIESEIDVLDDGYRWRKYGQKVVKGNPNPRSYYKCTSAGCPVRKHVERASHNLKSVITTYEGKHNHEVPVAKNNSQGNSVAASLPPTVNSTPPMVALGRTTNASELEPHIPDLAINFERNQAPREDFMRPYIMGNFGPDMKFGAPAYQVKLPPLANSMSYGSFLVNPNHRHAHTGCSVSSVLPGYPFSLPMTIPGSADVNHNCVDLNSNGKPKESVQSFLDGQQLHEKFVTPKKEKNDIWKQPA